MYLPLFHNGNVVVDDKLRRTIIFYNCYMNKQNVFFCSQIILQWISQWSTWAHSALSQYDYKSFTYFYSQPATTPACSFINKQRATVYNILNYVHQFFQLVMVTCSSLYFNSLDIFSWSDANDFQEWIYMQDSNKRRTHLSWLKSLGHWKFQVFRL